MAKYQIDDIRNVAVVGHGGAGKTSLVDVALYKADASERKGSVDDGTSLSDFEDEEKQRKISIDSSVLRCSWKGKQLHFIDTPGYPDFIGASLSSLPAAETALVVIGANDGIQVNTRRVFAAASERGLGKIIVLNKLDGENVDFDALIDSIQETFGKNCTPLNLPIGLGEELSGIVDLLNPPDQMPPGVISDAESLRSQLMESVVESDEELMMRYLEGEELSVEEIQGAVNTAICSGSLVPILCCSSRKDIGVAELLDTLASFALSPKQLPRELVSPDGEPQGKIEANESATVVAQVFKSVTDPFVGKLSYLRVLSGKLTADSPLQNTRTGKACKIGNLLQVQGKSQENVSEAIPGDIVAVAKVDDLDWGDTISSGSNGAALPPIQVPTPMVSLAVMPKSRGDEGKISGSFTKISEEDPTLRVNRDRETKEMVISGMSDLHLNVVLSRLKRRFQLEVDTKSPRIPYRETVSARAEGSYRHKKQSGGRGQFGEVHIRVFPLPREGIDPETFITKDQFPQARGNSYHKEVNFLFIDAIVGGSIPNQFIPAVEKGIRESIDSGVLAGYVVQDVGVELHFGKDHPVDSSEAAFKIAGSMAFKECFQQARPVILEPIVIIEVNIPTQFMGDIMADLSGRRGRIQGSETLAGSMSVIKGQIPLGEVADYSRSLGSITAGQGSYSLEPSHYDVVPGNVQSQIVEQARKEKEAAQG